MPNSNSEFLRHSALQSAKRDLLKQKMSSEDDIINNGDLLNVPSVRLVDVQPLGRHLTDESDEEVLETSVIDDMSFEECIVDDQDSIIGSMVSIQSAEDDSAELIVSSMIVGDENVNETNEQEEQTTTSPLSQHSQERWPTLEILPGGVINSTNDNIVKDEKYNEQNDNEMMYACAKCSERFKYLYNLVKHVKWHDDQAKVFGNGPDNISKLMPQERELILIKRQRNELDKEYQQKKLKVYSRIASAIAKIHNFDNLFTNV